MPIGPRMMRYRPFAASLVCHKGAQCGEEGMSIEAVNNDTGDSNPLEIVDRPSGILGEILLNIWMVIPDRKKGDGLDGWLDGSASVKIRLNTRYLRTAM